MTNEKMAELIQQGNNNMVETLWENVLPLLYSKSKSFYNCYETRCKQAGIELEDIYQECYSVLLTTIKYFRVDTGLKFTTFLDYPFKSMFFNLVGLRTKKNEPLNNCTSFDKSIEHDGEACTLLDIISDDNSDKFIQYFDDLSEAETIRKVVEGLQEPYKYVIEEYFFNDTKLIDISEVLDISPERVRQIKSKALNILRKNEIIKNIYKENKLYQRWASVSRYVYSPNYYDLIQNLNQKIIRSK